MNNRVVANWIVVILLVGLGFAEGCVSPARRGRATSAHAGQALPRIVNFGTATCPGCKEMAPILKALRKEYAGRAAVDSIDVLKDPDAGRANDIRVVPTQVFYDRMGNKVWRHEGELSKRSIVAKLKKLGA